jgi:hypothetical protein
MLAMSESEGEFSSWLLRTEPSVRLWSIELRDIMSGSREGAISRFGGPSDYVKSILFNSLETSVAEYCFDEALRRLVESWRPLANPDTESDLRMLQLLAAFTPSEGVGRILALLRNLNSLDEFGVDGRVRDLKPVVLQVLEQYFEVAQSPLGAFEEYVAQLEFNLAHPDYAVYVVARLRELRRLQAKDSRLGAVLQQNPQLLKDLLKVFVPSLGKDSRDISYLTELYRHCLHLAQDYSILTEFEYAVRELGVRFERYNNGPYLEAADLSWRKAIKLEGEDLNLYYVKVHFRLASESLGEKLLEVNRESAAEVEAVSYELDLEETIA